MNEKEFNVNDDWREKQAKIVEKLKKAYEQRKEVISFGGSDVETLNNDKELHERLKNLNDDSILTFNEKNLPTHWVLVDNPHEYPFLLEAAFKTFENRIMRVLFRKAIIKKIFKILKHEFAHHVPGLGIEGLKIQYGVEFSTDKKKKQNYLKPFILLNGSIKYSIYKKILLAPEDRSASDNMKLGIEEHKQRSLLGKIFDKIKNFL